MVATIVSLLLAAGLAAIVFTSVRRIGPWGRITPFGMKLVAAGLAVIAFIGGFILSMLLLGMLRQALFTSREAPITATVVVVVPTATATVACPQGQVCIPAATAAAYATVVARGASAPPPTATTAPRTTTATPVATAAPAVMPVTETHLGLNVWGGAQIALPQAPAGADQLYIAHGDVDGSGSCHVWVWESGRQVAGLSAATWQLYLITGGSREDRLAVVTNKQRAAAAQSGTCPMVIK